MRCKEGPLSRKKRTVVQDNKGYLSYVAIPGNKTNTSARSGHNAKEYALRV